MRRSSMVGGSLLPFHSMAGGSRTGSTSPPASIRVRRCFRTFRCAPGIGFPTWNARWRRERRLAHTTAPEHVCRFPYREHRLSSSSCRGCSIAAIVSPCSPPLTASIRVPLRWLGLRSIRWRISTASVPSTAWSWSSTRTTRMGGSSPATGCGRSLWTLHLVGLARRG